MQNILFRADSSSSIGTGHTMRDLVLASQFENTNIIFAVRDLPGNINHKIHEEKYTIEVLQSNDIGELLILINKYSIDMIIIDHYGINYAFEKELKEKTGVRIFVLDDTYEKHYCDILLNHNIYADAKRYKTLVPKNCQLRCGADYTLLRKEFIEEKKNNILLKKSIFIGIGGTDTHNITQEILKIIVDLTDSPINVVTTTSNPNIPILKDFILTRNNITLHINSNHIAALMNQSFLAIISPSVILNELFYMGVPFIAIQTADNQKEMVSFLEKEKYSVIKSFDAEKLKKVTQNKIPKDITLINFINLTMDEKKMVLTWRNHPDVKKWMYMHNNISLESHLNFIEILKDQQDKIYFVVKQKDDYLGVIDFYNITVESCKFGLYTNPQNTTFGFGKILIEQCIQYAFEHLRIDTLRLEVFSSNKRALNIYEKFGFKETATKTVNQKEVIFMELKNENR